MITFGLPALPCGDGRTLRRLGTWLADVPLDELPDDLRGAAFPATFGRWTGGNERLPHVWRQVDGQLRSAVGGHRTSLSGGYPVSLDNPLWVGTHPDTMNSMDATEIARSLTKPQRRALSAMRINGSVDTPHLTVLKSLDSLGLTEHPGGQRPWRERVLTDLGRAVRAALND